MWNELKEIVKTLELADEIEGMLPDEQHAGYTILSLVIDKYSHRMGMPTRKAWEMMYNTAITVCDQMGEYGGEMSKAYVNGEEVTILHYTLVGYVPSAKVRVENTGWVIEVPTAFIEIR